jgi:hypothetical protein
MTSTPLLNLRRIAEPKECQVGSSWTLPGELAALLVVLQHSLQPVPLLHILPYRHVTFGK